MAPLYRQVADTLSDEIRDGVHRVGTLLPSEAELRARFQVSRQTVREALRLLVEAGLVSRRQGAGTLVERERGEDRYVQRLGRLPDLSRYVRETRRTVLKITDVSSARAAVPLPGDPRASWRMLEGLRYVTSDRKPIAWTRIFVRSAYASVTTERDRDELPIHALVERCHGVQARSVRQEIAGVVIDDDVAALLRVPAESVGLSIRREYVSTAGEIFEVAISVHPADRYRYRTELELDPVDRAASSSHSRKRG
jgi:DNA-binding GntR family transcriptional regulator